MNFRLSEDFRKENTMTSTNPKFPGCVVELLGHDGNAFAILGRVTKALKSHLKEQGATPEVAKITVDTFQTEAMAGDYDALLQTCMRWVTVE